MSLTLHTDAGNLKFELFCEECPITCTNFLALAASDYYDGCVFHRNIKGFVVQTGDPSNSGKNGESIWGSRFRDEIKDSLKHKTRGILAMANAGKPDTNGSQFYITYGPQPSLDLKSTVFGKLIDGFDTLDTIEKAQVDGNFRPIKDIAIRSVTIHANPIADNSL